MEDKNIINFDEMDRDNTPPRFVEKIRRDQEGKISAYVLKRNPKIKK